MTQVLVLIFLANKIFSKLFSENENGVVNINVNHPCGLVFWDSPELRPCGESGKSHPARYEQTSDLQIQEFAKDQNYQAEACVEQTDRNGQLIFLPAPGRYDHQGHTAGQDQYCHNHNNTK